MLSFNWIPTSYNLAKMRIHTKYCCIKGKVVTVTFGCASRSKRFGGGIFITIKLRLKKIGIL